MNLYKRLLEVASIPMTLLLLPRQIRFSISRKEWVDFSLVLMVSVLILIYKLNKA